MGKVLKQSLLLALIYVVLGPLALLLDSLFAERSAVVQLALPITVVAVVFLAVSMLSLALTERAAKVQTGAMTLYLIDNIVRLLAAVVMVVVYGLSGREGIVFFTIDLLLFYVATLAFMVRHNLHLLRHQEPQSSSTTK